MENFGLNLQQLIQVPQLEMVIEDHIVDGLFLSADLSDGDVLIPFSQNPLLVAVSVLGTLISVGGGAVEQADVVASNGAIHFLSSVICPPYGFPLMSPMPTPAPEPTPVPIPAPRPAPAPGTSKTEITIYLELLQVAETYMILPAEIYDASLGVLSTLFAPVDAAMSELIANAGFELDDLLAPMDEEIEFLTVFFFDHTILGDRLFKDDLFALDGSAITALSTNKLFVEVKPNMVDLCVGGAPALQFNLQVIQGSNMLPVVLHTLCEVMLPPFGFSTPMPMPIPSPFDIVPFFPSPPPAPVTTIPPPAAPGPPATPIVLFSIFTDEFVFPFTSDFSFGNVQIFLSMTTFVTGEKSIFTSIGSFASFKVGTSNPQFFFGEGTFVHFWVQPFDSDAVPTLSHLEVRIGSVETGDLLNFALGPIEVGVWTEFLVPVEQCSDTFEIHNPAFGASLIRVDDIDVITLDSQLLALADSASSNFC